MMTEEVGCSNVDDWSRIGIVRIVVVAECFEPVNLAARIGLVIHNFCVQRTGGCRGAAVQFDLFHVI